MDYPAVSLPRRSVTGEQGAIGRFWHCHGRVLWVTAVSPTLLCGTGASPATVRGQGVQYSPTPMTYIFSCRATVSVRIALDSWEGIDLPGPFIWTEVSRPHSKLNKNV